MGKMNIRFEKFSFNTKPALSTRLSSGSVPGIPKEPVDTTDTAL